MVLTTILSMMRYVSEIDDRDFVDRLHSYFTTNMLIGLSVLVSFKQFGGKPIECLTPDIFSGAWEEYAENYCWAQDTYFVSPTAAVESLGKLDRKERRISYYQWVPFFLLIEAACFRLPSLLWRYMSGHSGIKIGEIVKMSSDPNNIKPNIRKANIHSMSIHLQGALRFHKRIQKRHIHPHRLLRLFNLAYSSSYVTAVYLVTKFAYLANATAQLMLMNSFLETEKYRWYGFGAVLDLLNGTTWEQSGIFPRVSLCDFEVRVMGNLQEYTIQCVLVINIFNEKIFVLLWFWYLCLLVLTLGSFLYWLSVFIFPWPNIRFITQHLEMCEMPFDPESRENKKHVRHFVNDYLRQDGLFVIRMLTLHTGVIFGTDLVQALWMSYIGPENETMLLKRSNSFPEGEFMSSPGKDHPDAMELENAVNRMRRMNRRLNHGNRRGSSIGAGVPPPAITFGDKMPSGERLIPPPAPSPRAMRMLERLDRSRTNSFGSGTTSPVRTINNNNLSPEKQQQELHRRSVAKNEAPAPENGGESSSSQYVTAPNTGSSSSPEKQQQSPQIAPKKTQFY